MVASIVVSFFSLWLTSGAGFSSSSAIVFRGTPSSSFRITLRLLTPSTVFLASSARLPVLSTSCSSFVDHPLVSCTLCLCVIFLDPTSVSHSQLLLAGSTGEVEGGVDACANRIHGDPAPFIPPKAPIKGSGLFSVKAAGTIETRLLLSLASRRASSGS